MNQVFVLAVMYIKDSRAIGAAERQGELCPVIVPWIIDKLDGYVGMDRRITVNQLLKQVVTAPFPEFYGNVFSVVDRLSRIILYSISNRLCRHRNSRAPGIFSISRICSAASHKACHRHCRCHCQNSRSTTSPTLLHFKLLLILFP